MTNTWNDTYKQMWEDRYEEIEYAYGKAPNEFFATQLQNLKPGSILMPADGEGRNGVFAAKSGWKVSSFDLSNAGKTKALELAAAQQVELDYKVGDLEVLEYEPESFDAIGLIYAHFAADKKSIIHQKLQEYLKPGGYIIFEAFSKNHIAMVSQNPKVGGPKDVNLLFSLQELARDFKGYEFLVLEEAIIDLDEGKYHIGKGSVVRLAARKP
ncbi:class I SAM-dependent methyltransferase [Pedobacter nyackensis]|uniref:Methyltransferase domain-containing protein n=1 Tax=Pedobacter nyackensis TaxID=475255 RepID=A0A1W2F5P4_9SPHI|nr:class I SAM-dependent methyltransferase [Pedobacter nyackensis]SMD17245.1 Methyltransferase domain-containing protein [Pedobacter nyackensis]